MSPLEKSPKALYGTASKNNAFKKRLPNNPFLKIRLKYLILLNT
jgi:hypothetical protein